MMTSVLLVDVQGFEALAKGQADPSALLNDLAENKNGSPRHMAVIRAYCSNRVSSYRRTAYRESGFEIVETSSPDETLIRLSLDLHGLATNQNAYGEAIVLGGSSDYTALARLARENLMAVAVVDHPALSSTLKMLAETVIELDDLEIDRSAAIPAAPSFTSRERKPIEPLTTRPSIRERTEKAAEKVESGQETKGQDAQEQDTKSHDAKEPKAKDGAETKSDADKPHLDHPEQHKPDSDRKEGDAWPDPKTGPILVAGSGAGAGASALMANGATAPSAADDTSTEKDATTSTADTKASNSSSEPSVDAELEDAIAASLSDDLAEDLTKDVAEESADDSTKQGATESGDDFGSALDAELEAELTAELTADEPADASAPETTADEKQVASTNGAPNIPVDDDSTIDALFADLAAGSETSESADSETKVAPAVIAAPVDVPAMADAEADADVDQLLSRLISDDLSTGAGDPKKADLDVVPER